MSELKSAQIIVIDSLAPRHWTKELNAFIVEGTGLPAKKPDSRVGNTWTWDYSEVPEDLWKAAVGTIRNRMVDLYNQRLIRGGSCGFEARYSEINGTL